MFNAIVVLVRARLQILRNTFWRGRLVRKLGILALAALILFGAFGFYSFARFVVRALRSPQLLEVLREAATRNPDIPSDPAPYLAAVPSVVLLAALGLLVFSSFSSLLNSLFLSGDMDMLLVAPVPMRAVFVVKFFGGLLAQYLLLAALLGPVLLGYGQGMGYGPLYHLSAVIALLLTPLLPAGVGALLVMAVVRVLPARRAREIVSILGGLVGVSFYLLSQLGGQVAGRVATPENLGALLAADMPLLPSAWAGRALVAAGEGETLPLLFYGGLFVLASLAVFAGCLLLAERLYYAGWSNLAAEGGRISRARRDERQPRPGEPQGLSLGDRLLAPLPRQSRAIFIKDLRLFSRDLRNLQALIFPVALAAIWTYQVFSGPPRATPRTPLPEWAAQLQELAGVGIAFFICLSLSTALAGTGVSREGKTFWILKLAPISSSRLLLGKLALAFLPFPLIGTLFLFGLGVARGVSPLLLIQQWGLLILGGLGCAAFGMGLGAFFPRLDWENPAQQSTWQTGCIGTIFYPLFLAAIFSLIAGAGLLAQRVGGSAAGAAIAAAGWALAAALTAAVVWLSLELGKRGLERIEI
jgi:ABC-2 type transport system permease protein